MLDIKRLILLVTVTAKQAHVLNLPQLYLKKTAAMIVVQINVQAVHSVGASPRDHCVVIVVERGVPLLNTHIPIVDRLSNAVVA